MTRLILERKSGERIRLSYLGEQLGEVWVNESKGRLKFVFECIPDLKVIREELDDRKNEDPTKD